MRFPPGHQARINEIFNAFAGREVAMRELMLGCVLKAAPADPDAPVLAEMRAAAQSHGLTLRLSYPGAVHTRDMRADRVNASIQKDGDGKWRIGNSFYPG